MSVILFDQQSIDHLLGMIKFHHKEVAQIIEYSPHYSHYLKYSTVMTPNAKYEKSKDYIGRLLWYTIVSNRVVYMLQCHADVSLFDIRFDYANVKVVFCTIKQLIEELASLNYNMTTTDGNKFMAQEWHEPFEMIRNRLAQKLARK